MGEPGALPLLSFTLRDLFEAEETAQGQPMDMTLSEYLQRGGIESALERHANHILESLSPEEQELAKGIFSKLITVGEGQLDTRRTAVFEELVSAGVDAEAVAAVVRKLSAEGVRLLTTNVVDTGDLDLAGQTTVTLANEILIDAWPWLRQLVDENRELITLQNQINKDARDWEESEGDYGYLYMGGRLQRVEDVLDELQPSLDALSRAFLQASFDYQQRQTGVEPQAALSPREMLRSDTGSHQARLNALVQLARAPRLEDVPLLQWLWEENQPHSGLRRFLGGRSTKERAEMRLGIVRALAAGGYPDALPVLEAARKDADERVREAAAAIDLNLFQPPSGTGDEQPEQGVPESEDIIGRYEIRRELGRGGMATVYLAYDPRFQREVAIKVLPRQFTYDPKYMARFEQEARVIAQLEHPAIVPTYDFGEHDNAPYLVMRYMAGGPLRDRLSAKPLPLEEIAALLERVAPALDKAHNARIVHRDLKPANILFDEDSRPYLADFSIARLAEASQTMTVVGTPAYMSPEQVEGTLALDGRADIYALGVILYELLTGRQPFEGETPTKQMMAHVLLPVPNILEANPDLPPATQEVIEKSMAKDREDRYQSAREMATAVNALLALQTTAEKGAGAEPQVELATRELLESRSGNHVDRLNALAQLARDSRSEDVPLLLELWEENQQPSGLQRLLRGRTFEEHAEIRLGIVRALAAGGYPDALPVLEAARKDADEKVREAAAAIDLNLFRVDDDEVVIDDSVIDNIGQFETANVGSVTPPTYSDISDEPYVGPRTFRTEDRPIFFGRERETRELIDTILSGRITLFYAPSGAGRSSLLNTKVLPGLEDEGFEVLPVGRVSGNSGHEVTADNIFVYNLISSLHQGDQLPQDLAKMNLPVFLELVQLGKNKISFIMTT